MKRWIALSLGMAVAAAAGYSLLTLGLGERRTPTSVSLPESTRPAATRPARPDPEPTDHIDQASRDALRDILRGADGPEERAAARER